MSDDIEDILEKILIKLIKIEEHNDALANMLSIMLGIMEIMDPKLIDDKLKNLRLFVQSQERELTVGEKQLNSVKGALKIFEYSLGRNK